MSRHYKPMSPASRDARADSRRAAAEAAGIPIREDADKRRTIALDLRCVGGPDLLLEPRRGYHSWRARDADTGRVVACAALKTLLHQIADDLPQMMAPRTAARH